MAIPVGVPLATQARCPWRVGLRMAVEGSLGTNLDTATHCRRKNLRPMASVPAVAESYRLTARRAGDPSSWLTSWDRSGHSQSHHGSEHKKVVIS